LSIPHLFRLAADIDRARRWVFKAEGVGFASRRISSRLAAGESEDGAFDMFSSKRKREDSNLRSRFQLTAFRVRPIRPLWHASALNLTTFLKQLSLLASNCTDFSKEDNVR